MSVNFDAIRAACPQQQIDLEDRRYYTPFSGLEVDLQSGITYRTLDTSYGYSNIDRKNRNHYVPETLEALYKEGKIRMLEWEIPANIADEEETIMWKGRYTVWYRSDFKGPLLFAKQWNPSPGQPWPRGGKVQYQDVKSHWKIPFWFNAEVANVLKAIKAVR